MTANLDLYQSMHPGVHMLLQHKLIISRKKDNQYKKPYKILRIPPPTPLINKWYLQHDIATTPLVQIRTSAIDLDDFYLSYKSVSTTITIYYLRVSAIQNANFRNIPTNGYSPRKTADNQPVWFWTTRTGQEITQNTKYKDLVFLGNTNKNQEGQPIEFKTNSTTTLQAYTSNKWGNPFYKKYLNKDKKVYFTTSSIATIINNFDSAEKQLGSAHFFTETELTDAVRYNPFRDQGNKNTIWLQSISETTTTWKPPESEIKVSKYLPLWLITHGFDDFQRKNHTVQNIDTDYMIVLQSNFQNTAIQETYPIIDANFIAGNSPYESTPNFKDSERWWPSIQFQQNTLNTIALSGPGSPKPPPLQAIQATANYSFYFKWGGNPPPMDSVTDPTKQPDIHLPTNFNATNSLQNPTTSPELYLYNFDERRGLLTDKAIKRLQKDYLTKEITFTDGSHFSAALQTPQETTSSEETTSEEEEETQILLNKLRKQRLKQKHLRHRIMQQMGIIPKSK